MVPERCLSMNRRLATKSNRNNPWVYNDIPSTCSVFFFVTRCISRKFRVQQLCIIKMMSSLKNEKKILGCRTNFYALKLLRNYHWNTWPVVIVQFFTTWHSTVGLRNEVLGSAKQIHLQWKFAQPILSFLFELALYSPEKHSLHAGHTFVT